MGTHAESDPLAHTAPAAGSNPSDPLARTALAIGTSPTAMSLGTDGRVPPAANDRPADDHPALIAIDPSHYILAQELARGGMGRIRVARDRRLGRKVAVKEVLVRDGDLARRFEREARITARLQHPSIMSVYEAGVWPSGMPFYSMPLVDGRSLHDVIDEKKTLVERMALLPNVLAVADAIAYAHGERVIHRDLKPKNVLVGHFGETVVIDWGLAKDLSDSSDSGAYRGTVKSGSGLETEVGEVMGTPAYMPPEQASGAPVDERADVYAIGAMLTHVLCGKPPYEGRSLLELLEAVKAGPPVSLSEREPATPPDLVTIVDRAMARDPAARYPSARELADDLRRFQTGQLVGAHDYSLRQLLWRWVVRQRTPLAVAGVAAALLVTFGIFAVLGIVHQRERADAQRTIAVASRGQADDLTQFMLFDLHDKLQGVGRLDLLATVADKAAAYYGARGADASLDEEAKRGTALSNIGDVLATKGDTTGALAQYRAALGVAQMLAAIEPGRPQRRLELARGYKKLGEIEQSRGDSRAAELAYRTSLAISERVVDETPSTAARLAVAQTQVKLAGLIAKHGDLTHAIVLYGSALTTAEDLARRDPTNVALLSLVAGTHGNLGAALRDSGDNPGSLVERRAALATTETLAARDPSNAEFEHARWNGHFDLGETAVDMGDVPEANRQFETARAIAEHLVLREPTNTEWQISLINTDDSLGNLLLDTGKPDGALQAYQAALRVVEPLATASTEAEIQHGIAAMHQRLGNVWQAKHQPKRAIDEYRIAIERYDTFAARDASNLEWQRDPGLVRVDLGEALLSGGDLAAAEDAYRQGVHRAEAVAAKDPANAATQTDLALARFGLATTLERRSHVAEALIEARAAAAILTLLVASDHSSSQHAAALTQIRATIARLEKR